MRILVVEDEQRLAESIAEILNEHKYTVQIAVDGETGYNEARHGNYDAIILDVMLPLIGGFEIVRRLRREDVSTPVLLLTALTGTVDKVTGLDAGADYYLTKPFETDELLACLRAVSRRHGDVVMDEMTFGDLTLNLSTSELRCETKTVRLGAKELEVLRLLIEGSPSVVSKEAILSRAWEKSPDAEDNNVEVYISFIRKKLRFIRSNVIITTIRKMGYQLEARNRI